MLFTFMMLAFIFLPTSFIAEICMDTFCNTTLHLTNTEILTGIYLTAIDLWFNYLHFKISKTSSGLTGVCYSDQANLTNSITLALLMLVYLFFFELLVQFQCFTKFHIQLFLCYDHILLSSIHSFYLYLKKCNWFVLHY